MPILLSDQLKEGDLDFEEIKTYAKEINVDENKLLKAAEKLTSVDNKGFKTAVSFIGTLTELIGSQAEEKMKYEKILIKNRKAEEALKESEQKFRYVLSNSVSTIYNFNLSTGTYDYVSPAVIDMYGFTPEEMISGGLKETIIRFHPDDLEKIENHLNKLLSKKIEDFSPTVEYRFNHPKLGYRWISDTRTIIFDENGDPKSLIGNAIDITGRIQNNDIEKFRNDISASIINKTDISQISKAVLEQILVIDEFDSGGIYLLDQKTGDLNLVEQQGLPKSFVDIVGNYKAKDQQTKLVLKGKPVYKRSSEFPKAISDDLLREKIQSLAVISILHDNDVIGTINLASHTHTTISGLSLKKFDVILESNLGIAISHVKALETIHDNEHRLRTLFNAMKDIVFEMDYEGTYLFIAPTSPDLMFNPSDGIIGLKLHDVFPKPEADIFLDFIQKCLDENKTDTIIYSLIINDKTVWFEGVATPKTKSSVLFIARDITERKKAETDLIESEEKFRSLYNNMSIGCGIWEKEKGDFVLVNYNKAGEDLDNLNKGEMIGKTVNDLFPDPSEKLDINNVFNNVISTGKSVFLGESSYVVSNKLVWRENHIFKLSNNELVTIFNDITDRKNAEKELLKLSTAVQQSPAVIAITDLKGRMEYVNPKFTELTGYSLDEVKNKNLNILRSGHSPDKIYEELWETIESGSVWHGEFHNKKKNGEGFWERASVSPIRNKQGQIINYIKVAEDISEIKSKEQELKTALEKAQESDRLKSAFLSNMSHEIRTPMNGILGFTELLKEPQLVGEKKDRYIKIIEKSGERMLNTINDIIDISKIEAGQVEIASTEISVIKVLEEQYDFFTPEAKSKGLDLIYKPVLSDIESNIITDKHKVEGILSNLIKNAIKYTKHGNITFGCSLIAENDLAELEFFVTDTGIGIPQERIEAVFNRFEQADIEDSNVFEGSGLGLTISKSFVEMLGGKIWVNSKEGSGSTFRFTIPYNKRSVKVTTFDRNVKEEKGMFFKTLSMIVAEDDETSKMFFDEILSSKFKEIIYTTTGRDTIDRFKDNPQTNIILMDIRMPGMNGYEATREIRKFDKNVIIIAQTAFAISGDREKAIEAGCNDYITKPLNKNLLFKKILTQMNIHKKNTSY